MITLKTAASVLLCGLFLLGCGDEAKPTADSAAPKSSAAPAATAKAAPTATATAQPKKEEEGW